VIFPVPGAKVVAGTRLPEGWSGQDRSDYKAGYAIRRALIVEWAVDYGSVARFGVVGQDWSYDTPTASCSGPGPRGEAWVYLPQGTAKPIEAGNFRRPSK